MILLDQLLTREIDPKTDKAQYMFDYLLLHALETRAVEMTFRRAKDCCRVLYRCDNETFEITPMPSHLPQSAVAHFAELFGLEIPKKKTRVEISMNSIESAEIQYDVFGLSSVDIARITVLNNNIPIADCKSAIRIIFGPDERPWVRKAMARIKDSLSRDPYSKACREHSQKPSNAG